MRPLNSVHHRLTPRSLPRQTGAGLIEFSAVAVPLLLAGLGSIEIAQWFYTKQAVSLALVQAARAGITEHASPGAIEAAFEQGLLPLFPGTAAQTSRQRLQQALARRTSATNQPPWQIEIIGPSALAFQDFNDSSLTIAQHNGLAAINNNYQAEQDRRNRNRGWIDGLGPLSGQSIYHANTLILRATYLHEPLVPGIKALIRLLPTGANSYGQHAMATSGYLPIQQEMQLTMQSHPLNWPDLLNRKVIKQSLTPQYAPALPATYCQGLWCLKSGAAQPFVAPASGLEETSGTAQNADAPGQSSVASTDMPGTGTPPGSTSDSPPGSGLDTAPDDPACGITLCCLGV
ncbi:MAG TPA: TadE/TadG family type IV pilus assembly protein [Eoetvoesiella sp.]